MPRMTIAVIEDNAEDAAQIEDFCAEVSGELGIQADTMRFGSLDEFAVASRERGPDLLIADLRLEEAPDDRSGWDSVRQVLAREVVPVVVYSAYAATEPEGPFRNVLIERVTKGEEDVHRFKSVLTRFMGLKGRLNEERQRVDRVFSALTLETVRDTLGEGEQPDLENGALAAMAVARLASSLINIPSVPGERFPPEAAFIYPPLQIPGYSGQSVVLGDVLGRARAGQVAELWVVVSPSCDTVFTDTRHPKVQDLLLLRCYTRDGDVPFLDGRGERAAREDAVTDRLRRGTARMLKCPAGVFGGRYMLVSFKDYRTLPYRAVQDGLQSGEWKRVATLATPYAESLQSLLIRDLSRIGTPETASYEDEARWAKEFVQGAL